MARHILVVEDSTTVSMAIRSALDGAGFQITVCGTCAAARAALWGETRFALVILDVILPDGDGRAILREVRRDPGLKGLPVLLLSSAAEIGNRMYGLNVGADGYIGKPCEGGYLVRRVQEALRMHEDTLGSEAGPPQGGAKILLVDDSPTFLASMAEQLQQEGHEVVQARSGADALNLLAVDQVDCVILDLLMPRLDGIETCRRIRDMPERQGLPIMILTGSDEPSARSAARNAGADEFGLKSQPVDGWLQKLLQKQRAGRPPAQESQGDARPPAGASEVVSRPINNLFERVVAVSGLPSQLGRVTIERACQSVGIDPVTLSPGDLLRALSAITEALKPHLGDEQRLQRMEVMTALARLAERSAQGAASEGAVREKDRGN
jgi:DNA-binding response OmpR family regulator